MRLSANRHDQISVSDGSVTHVGIALTFGLIVTAMIYSIGDVWGPYQSGGDNRVLDIGTACSARSSCLCNCSNCWSDLGKCIIASPVFRSPRSRDDITCWPLVEIVRLPSRANLYLDVRHPELFNRCEFDRNLYRRLQLEPPLDWRPCVQGSNCCAGEETSGDELVEQEKDQ